MRKNSGLINKINRAFLLQGVLISIAVLLSVFFAKVVIEEILIKNAIEQEAGYFWDNRLVNNDFPLPDTLNLTGYFIQQQLPGVIRANIPDQPGFYEYEETGNRFVLQISHRGQDTLYLVYNRGQVDSLAAYYGLFPLALVLIVLYLSLWVTYRFSRRTISPVSWLARQVNEVDFSSRDFSSIQTDNLPYDADDDFLALSEAIIDMGSRLESFIERERNFTRDASHELRSPLTVINIAADMLQSEHKLPKAALDTVSRIKRATKDMEELIESFLLLARESDQALSKELVCINDVIESEIDRVQLINKTKALKISYSAQDRLHVQASDKVVSVLFGNLLRNAVLYTEQGGIDVVVRGDSVIIKDSGKGISDQQVSEIFKPYYRGNTGTVGHGVGLTIVKRLSDRFNWPISIKSAPGMGTSVEVRFPNSGS